MSNLSELLPAGAGAKSASFVASGTLGSGVTVALKSDGTVEAVTSQAAGIGTATVYDAQNVYEVRSTYDTASGKVVVIYRRVSGGDGMAVVGTVSGTSISYGTPVVFETGTATATSIAYDANAQKVVIAYKANENSNYGTSIVGTVSGTSISFGTKTVFESASTDNTTVVYDANAQKVVIAYRDAGNSNQGTARVGTVSGTSISFGSTTVFETSNSQYYSGAYDSANQKIVIAYVDYGNNPSGGAAVGTISGTSISFGSPVHFGSSSMTYTSATYDVTNAKVVIAYADGINTSGRAIVGTVSGTSISFGSPAVFEAATSSWVSSVYSSGSGTHAVAYNSTNGKVIEGTVSGDTISFGTATVFVGNTVTNVAVAYDSADQKPVISFRDAGNSNYGTGVVYTNFSTNSASFIGITDQAIADTATGAVIVQGGVVSGVTLPYYYSFGTDVVFDTANYTDYLSAVYDSSAQKVVYFYPDFNNSGYGTAVVGTVSGSSISFGTPVVFESANTSWIASTYDSASSKVVVAYSDAGNSDYATAAVGTVSGTSISFGTPVVFQTSRPNYTTATFDSSNNKVVIAYQDNLNSNYGTVVIGTVSGTSISFGTPVVFNSATTYYPALTFDSNTNKVVLAYRDGNNGNAGTARVGTVSGSSISFGSAAVFQSLSSNYMAATFDSNSNKVFIYYYRTGSSDGVVGTVSGTSISFGTPVSFGTTQTTLASATFDSNLNKVFVAYKDNGNSNYGTVVDGTISGTTVTFGDNTVFAAVNAANSPNIVFDSATNKTVIGYTNTAVTGSGTSIVTDFTNALVTSSDYYVQADGTLSTTVSSVPAGRALSSTSILLEG